MKAERNTQTFSFRKRTTRMS